MRVLVLALLIAGCAKEKPPGYDEPYPSADGQGAANALSGRTVKDGAGVEWTVGEFGVVPNPVTGKGPVIFLKRGADTKWVPLETDGDVADLHKRVTGNDHPTLKKGTSENYRSAWK